MDQHALTDVPVPSQQFDYGLALLNQQGGWTLGELRQQPYAMGSLATPTDFELALIEATRAADARESRQGG